MPMHGKFECNLQGCCCANLRGQISKDEIEEYNFRNKNGQIYYLMPPKDWTINLFEWEVKRLIEIAKEKNVNVELKPNIILFDEKQKVGIAIGWNLEHDNCPFLSNLKCSIYTERPLACRLYPLKGIFEPEDGTAFVFKCPRVDKNYFGAKLKMAEALKLLRSYFGDIFYYSEQNHFLNRYTIELIKFITNKGKFKPNRSKPLDFFRKKIEKSKMYGLEEFLQLNNIPIEKYVKQREELQNIESFKKMMDTILDANGSQ